MYVQIGKDRIVRMGSIVAVIPEKDSEDRIRSRVYTERSVYSSPYRAQALVKKIEDGRL